MNTLVHVRLTPELAKALSDKRKNSFVKISAFCRRAIERELARPVVDEKQEQETR